MKNMVLPIRPKLQSGECLSSFLVRASRANSLLYMDVINLVSFKEINRRNYHNIDLNPGDYLHIEKLKRLLSFTEEQWRESTLLNVLYNLYDDPEKQHVQLLRDLIHHYEKKYRRFCPLCLKGDGVFRLLWQIKHIESCPIHKMPLHMTCSVCKEEQPFLHVGLAYLQCWNCQALYTEGNAANSNGGLIDEDTHIHDIWRYILHEKEWDSETNSLSKEKMLTIRLLYYIHINPNKTLFSKHQLKNFKAFVRGIKKSRPLNLSDITSILISLQVSMSEFLRITIEDEFIHSLYVEKSESIQGVCLSPWCKHHGTSDRIKKVTTQYKKYKSSHRQVSVCDSCFIRFGFNTATQQWEDIENDISSIQKVKMFLMQKHSLKKIARETGIYHTKLSLLIGYMVYHKILPKAFRDKYEIRKIPRGTNAFMAIYNGSLHIEKLYHNGKKEFGWSIHEFSYYMASKEVQHLLCFSEAVDHIRSLSEREVTIKEVQELVLQQEFQTLQEVAVSLGQSIDYLYQHKINGDINTILKDQRKRSAKNQKKELQKDINQALLHIRNNTNKVTIDEFYKLISKTRFYVTSNFPDLALYISEQMKMIKEEVRRKEIENLCQMSIDVIKELRNEQTPVTNKEISEKLGMSLTKLNSLPEVMELIRIEKLRY